MPDHAGTECFTFYDGIKVELAFILVFTLQTLSFFKFFTYKVFNLPDKFTSDNIGSYASPIGFLFK